MLETCLLEGSFKIVHLTKDRIKLNIALLSISHQPRHWFPVLAGLLITLFLFSSSVAFFSVLSFLLSCSSIDICILVIVFFYSVVFISIVLFYFFAKTFWFSFVSSMLQVDMPVRFPLLLSFYASVCFYVAVWHLPFHLELIF